MEWLPPLKSKFAMWVFVVILVNNNVIIVARKGCLEEERKGLLEFKEFYNGTLVFPPDWIDGDCCRWQNVTCNEITGHVIEFSFHQILLQSLSSWSLNLSLFAPFKKLQRLDLSTKNINGFTETERGLASFDHLEILDLSENDLYGSIPSFIWALSSLKALSLANNYFNVSLPTQAFRELKKLEELDLSNNNLEGTLPQSLSNLTSLWLLDFSGNQFIGKISSSLIPSLTSLEYIDLSHNQFEGLFSFSSFANHTKLEWVRFISDNTKFEVETESVDWIPKFQLKVFVLSSCNLNNLSGEVPKFLLHQRSLKVINLSGNKLGGNFPYWLLENNTDLQAINLQRNSFSGMFRPPFSNVTFKWMDISDNHFSGRIPENIGQLFPGLGHLNLSRNYFDNGVPSSITNMSDLLHLDLSDNNFSGEFPTRVVTGCRQISLLLLSDNRFRGELPSTLSNSTDVWVFLRFLDISNNLLSGEIRSWISNVTSLEILALQNNFFEGQLPSVVANNFIDASNNSLSGSLPLITENKDLEYLHLRGNRFTGSIPESYVSLSGLLILDLSENNLSGSIPSFIGALSNLRILLLGGNHFTGSIPNQLCHLRNISLMDLSSNSISGSIPNCFRNITGPNNLAFNQREDFIYSFIFHDHGRLNKKLSYNYKYLLKQEVVNFVTKHRTSSYKGGILNFMSGLDFSCNNLTGEIPNQLGKLVQVHALNLSHNQLTGCIPKLFSHLANVESLDLSFNCLSGKIPSELINLTSLEVFIVAHNNLSGRVPEMKAQFGTFSNSSYEGNPFLCGPPLENNCTTLVPSSLPNASSSDESEDKWYEIDLLFFAASFVGTYFVFLLGVFTLLYMNPYWRRRWFNFAEECMYSCYYFLRDSLRNLSARL